ncbi:copper-binding protein [Maricaulaceae bacterium NA33B04]|nr:copper-binding protein [Maricaulaceae bacterium NA33B04]
MKLTPHLLAAASSAVLMAACSQPESTGPAEPDMATDTQMDHADMDHGDMDSGDMQAGMDHGSMGGGMVAAEASSEGVLNAINADAGSVNITHPPMPEIGWPEMTMDVPVSGSVDLSAFDEGDAVQFTVRRGRDDVFRIVEMTAAGAGE